MEAMELEMLGRVMTSFKERVQSRIDEGGRQLENFIFETWIRDLLMNLP